MNQSTPSPSASRRRIFLGADGNNYQLFTILQNPNDASVYFSAPNFEEIDWLVPAIGEDRNPILLSYKATGPGKLSLHGSGEAHVRPYEYVSPTEFVFRGNMLKSRDGESLGVRHLLTLFFAEPLHQPNSPATARQSDYVIEAKQFHPYVIILWAVPAIHALTVSINGSFNVDDLEEVPPNAGWGTFTLVQHSIVWFAYRTKHMARWPRNSQACYYDGHAVPMLIGTSVGAFRLEFRQPTYTLVDDRLTIAL
jgi:hypothetical protein